MAKRVYNYYSLPCYTVGDIKSALLCVEDSIPIDDEGNDGSCVRVAVHRFQARDEVAIRRTLCCGGDDAS